MAYKQNFKSPILKALVGKQKNLPQHLQDAIKAAPESPAKQTIDPPKMRKKQFEKAKGEMQKRREKRPTTTMKEKREMAKLSKKTKPTVDLNSGDIKFKKKSPKSPAKKGEPKKGSKYKGGGRKTDAQMADRARRVDEGLTVRRNDYAPGKDGQAAFNADRRASFDNRRAYHADIRTRLKSGEITKQEASRERNDYAKRIQKSASYRKTAADRNKGDAPTTYIISRKGIKRKVSDAEKASYNSVAKKKGPGKRGKSNKLSTAQAIGAGYVEAGSRDTRSERRELKKQLAGASSNAEKTKIKKKLRMAERSQRNYDVNKRRNQSIDKRAKVLDEAGSKSDLVRADNLRSQKRSGSKGVGTYKTVTDVKVKRRPKISEMNSPAKKYKK